MSYSQANFRRTSSKHGGMELLSLRATAPPRSLLVMLATWPSQPDPALIVQRRFTLSSVKRCDKRRLKPLSSSCISGEVFGRYIGTYASSITGGLPSPSQRALPGAGAIGPKPTGVGSAVAVADARGIPVERTIATEEQGVFSPYAQVSLAVRLEEVLPTGALKVKPAVNAAHVALVGAARISSGGRLGPSPPLSMPSDRMPPQWCVSNPSTPAGNISKASRSPRPSTSAEGPWTFRTAALQPAPVLPGPPSTLDTAARDGPAEGA
eukprot:scaffold247538_cov32-Tisochrysis_lutea.AAC.6